jgi:transaldolase
MDSTIVNELDVKIFADGAQLPDMLKLSATPYVKGFTTNPTLMRQCKVTDYEFFARALLEQITDKPISFEVLSDDFSEMARQARCIASWGPNVYVKIPIVNTRNQSSIGLIEHLVQEGVKLNVTAILSKQQMEQVVEVLSPHVPSFVSIFAGRIADTGRDPLPFMTHALKCLKGFSLTELIWASPRELFNLIQANLVGCHAITLSKSLLDKLPLLGKDLDHYSLETVHMFYQDALESGLIL